MMATDSSKLCITAKEKYQYVSVLSLSLLFLLLKVPKWKHFVVELDRT